MSDRWNTYPLTASERPKTLYEYHVTGRGHFPFDMLRYDCAYPADGESAAKLEWEQINPRGRETRSVKLRSYREPTVDRWNSFLWSVGEKAVVP